MKPAWKTLDSGGVRPFIVSAIEIKKCRKQKTNYKVFAKSPSAAAEAVIDVHPNAAAFIAK